MRSSRLVSGVAVALLLGPVVLCAQVPPVQRDALIALYNSTNGASWSNHTGWLGDPGTECTWRGVVCDSARTNVVALRLQSNRLRGSLPPQIGNLTSLTEITVRYNDLDGDIPVEIGRLTQLAILDATSNALTGPLPAELGNLKSLWYVDLSFNDMGGSLPESLLGMTNLQLLDIRFNHFEGRLPDFTVLRDLQWLGIGGSGRFEGRHVLANIGALSNLTYLNLGSCNLSGPIPFDQLARLPLKHIGFDFNHFAGTIPREFAQIPTLQELDLTGNEYDTIPDEILGMTSLHQLWIAFNRFSGPLPALERLTKLETLSITGNQFSGQFPANLSKTLSLIFCDWNRLSGPLPDLTRFPNLGGFSASGNDFTGQIPPALGDLPNLFSLFLDSNRLTGSIPPQLSRPPFMILLDVSSNALTGEIPGELADAPFLSFLRVDNNMLRASDPAVASLVKALNPGGLESQTLPPTGLAVTGSSAFAASVTWDRLVNTAGPGGVQVSVSTSRGGPYVPLAMTPSKDPTSVLVSGLRPATQYFTVAKAVTFANSLQANTLFSDPSAEVTFSTSTAEASPAEIAAIVLPETLTQEPDAAGGTSSYRIANIGGAPANVTLSQVGDFFVQSPLSFTLAPGASQIVTLAGLARPQDAYAGQSIADAGAAGKVSVAVRLLSASSSSVGARLSLSTRRIDLVTTQTDPASGSFTVTNTGTDSFVGILSADVEWISAPAALLRVAPGQTEIVTFTVDPKKRPDPSLLTGTVSGTLSLVSVFRLFGKKAAAGGSTSATISISLTTAVDPSESAFPPLPPGQVAYFLPGVGNVQGRVGLFLSDLSLLNASGIKPIDDLKLYYSAIGGSSSPLLAAVSSMPVAQSVFVGNVVKNVFRGEGQVGVLQVRTSQWDQLGIAANVLNVSNPAGTYGTSIPAFRSDRAAGFDGTVWLTGLRKDSSSYTNLFIQETAGSAGAATIDILNGDGAVVFSRQENLGAYETRQINDIVPSGGVAARLTGNSATMRFHAFATPVDASSGDNWSVVDWTRQYGYDPFESVVIPIAGGAAGAGGTNFRTDVAMTSTNAECPPQTLRRCGRNDVVLTYHINGGGTIERSVTLQPRQTRLLDDIATGTFNAPGTIGWIMVSPSNGSLIVTSRTYNLVLSTAATFGSAVGTIAVSRALRPGQMQRFAGITDDTSSDVVAQRPATYRNNIGVVEVLGEPAQIRLTLSYLDGRGTKVTANLTAQKEFSLAPGQMLLVPLTSSILGAGRDELGTLRNVRVDVEVIGATGGVLTFISSVDNGTGDSIIRTE
ncbi:MAG TPA: hypothetical protein VLV78_07680 [Thermoanaerobaculia bacterium]|nr:hypothetical protein [Thermoanaerobaculia bacterium]